MLISRMDYTIFLINNSLIFLQLKASIFHYMTVVFYFCLTAEHAKQNRSKTKLNLMQRTTYNRPVNFFICLPLERSNNYF